MKIFSGLTESRRGLAVLVLLFGTACTPQQALISALVPDGTASVLLGHMGGVADANRQRVAELEKQGEWSPAMRVPGCVIIRVPWRISANWCG